MMLGYKTSVRKCPNCNAQLEGVEQTGKYIRYECLYCTNETYLFNHSDDILDPKVFDHTKTCICRDAGCVMLNKGIWGRNENEIMLVTTCRGQKCSGRNVWVIL